MDGWAAEGMDAAYMAIPPAQSRNGLLFEITDCRTASTQGIVSCGSGRMRLLRVSPGEGKAAGRERNPSPVLFLCSLSNVIAAEPVRPLR